MRNIGILQYISPLSLWENIIFPVERNSFLNHFTLFSKQGWESLFSLFLTHERFAFYERKVRSFFRANRSFFPLNHTSKGETNFCALLNSSLFSLSLSLLERATRVIRSVFCQKTSDSHEKRIPNSGSKALARHFIFLLTHGSDLNLAQQSLAGMLYTTSSLGFFYVSLLLLLCWCCCFCCCCGCCC